MRVVPPSQEEVERFMDRTFWCEHLQARLTPEQCRINQKRAKKSGLEAAEPLYNVEAYYRCQSCPGLNRKSDDTATQSSPPEKRKCSKCKTYLPLEEHFDINPQTKKPFWICKKCRAATAHKRRTDANPPTITIARDGRIILFSKEAVVTFNLAEWPYGKFQPKKQRLVLCTKNRTKHTYRLSQKRKYWQTPLVSMTCAEAIRALDLRPGAKYLLSQTNDDRTIQLWAHG